MKKIFASLFILVAVTGNVFAQSADVSENEGQKADVSACKVGAQISRGHSVEVNKSEPSTKDKSTQTSTSKT